MQRFKHREYIKNTIKIPPPKSEKGGENEKKLKKFFKIGWANAHVTGTEDRYEMQDQKNCFVVYRHCDDARNILYFFCVQ